MPKIQVIKELLKMGASKGSGKYADYGKFKTWLHYQPIDQVEYDACLKEAVDWLGV